MNKKRIVVIALALMTAYQGYIVSDALAIPGEFQTMWAVDLPRVTYFIGESVTFTVVAFASTDPTLMLPDQMAKITIRNGSLAEVYEAWITTNVNGSAPVTWESGLDAEAGNYTIILDDLKGEKAVQHFMLLFNEETYWQVKVGMIEKELQANYGYLTYLFSYNKYLEKKVTEMERKMTIFGALAFITVMCGIYVAMHEAAGSKRNVSGLMSYPSKLLEIIGLRSRPIVELDHEEIASLVIPENKKPPIYGHDFFCPYCDKDREHPMLASELEEHQWAVHDRLHLKRDSIKAKWRQRKKESALKAEAKEEKAPDEPSFGTRAEYQKEWDEEQSKEQFQARLDKIKRQMKKNEISKAEAQLKISQLKTDLQKANESKPPIGVLKQTSSPKPQKTRKLRDEITITGILEKPVIKPPILVTPTQKIAPRNSGDLLDDLILKLHHEKR